MYKILAWFNVAFLTVMTAPWWMQFLNRHLLHLKGAARSRYSKVARMARKVHKPLGLVVLAVGITHGYLALGTLRLHSGLVLWLFLLATASLGGAYYRTKKLFFFTNHKRMALATVLVFLFHVL
ncbi:hypothetical protein [Anaerotalea alkaliphila]|uniref:Uncharacterized protein n=1 Tax=Anaerotalea alkaliphila TaxID=2662126 RepID=A0A7X5KMJ2_9FIRM|nr:hypothetical protein [Anaerotalea alkaliphila]NDL67019.1 hypothetical protein [Anaerotalea alkaliphila]